MRIAFALLIDNVPLLSKQSMCHVRAEGNLVSRSHTMPNSSTCHGLSHESFWHTTKTCLMLMPLFQTAPFMPNAADRNMKS